MSKINVNLRASCLNPQFNEMNENIVPRLIFQYMIKLPMHWDVILPPIMQAVKVQFACEASSMGKVSIPIFLTGVKTELNPLTIPFLSCLLGDKTKDNGIERDLMGYNSLPDYSSVLTWKTLKRAVESVHLRSLSPAEAYWIIRKYGLLSRPNQKYSDFYKFCQSFILKNDNDIITGFSISESLFCKIIGELDPKARLLRAQNKIINDLHEQRENITVSPPFIDWTGDGKIDTSDNMSGIQRYVQIIKSKLWLKKLDIISSAVNLLLSQTQKRIIDVLTQYISSSLYKRAKREINLPSYTTKDFNIVIAQLFKDNVLLDRCNYGFISYEGWGSYNPSDLDEGINVCVSFGKVNGNTPRHRNVLLKVYAKVRTNPFFLKHYPDAILKEGENSENKQFHISEHITGWKTLKYYLDKHGRLGGESGFLILKLWMNQLFSALNFLHTKNSPSDIGFAVCSLNPQDILVSPDGSTIKISNLYSCAPIGDDGTYKDRLMIDGLELNYQENNEYMSPELEKYLENPTYTISPTKRTDSWTLACIMTELLSGSRIQSYKTLYEKFLDIQKNAYYLLNFFDTEQSNDDFYFDFLSFMAGNNKPSDMELIFKQNEIHNNIYDNTILLKTIDNITLGELLDDTPVENGGLYENDNDDKENKNNISKTIYSDEKKQKHHDLSKLMFSVISVLVLCFQPDQNKRPVLDDLKCLDFFQMKDDEIEKCKKFAFQYVTSPKASIIINETFLKPIESFNMSLDHNVFDTIEFVNLLDQLLSYLVINDKGNIVSPILSCTTEYKKYMIKEIFNSEVIEKIINLVLRFSKSEIGLKVGYGNGDGFLEGNISESLGEKVLRRVVFFLFSICYELRDLDSLLSHI